jgi:hypothetical protein
MEVDIGSLQRMCNLLLDHLKNGGQTTLDIDSDFYWNIPGDSLYDQYSPPTRLDVGQLSADWEELVRIETGDSPPIGYALVWLSTMLRALGEKAVG